MSNPRGFLARRIVAIVAVIAFILVEGYVLSFAKYRYDHDLSVAIADELSVQLSLISASLQSGNKAIYSQAVKDYHSTLIEFSKNYYVRSEAKDLVRALDDYDDRLTVDADFISQIMELRIATATISTVSSGAKSSEIDALKVYDIAQNFINLRDGIEKITAPDLAEIAGKLTTMSNEIIQIADKSAVCISICTDNVLLEKQNVVEDIVKRYKDDLSKLGIAISEKYNPSQLILDLNNYCKL